MLKKGFTLVEVCVVVILILILAVLFRQDFVHYKERKELRLADANFVVVEPNSAEPNSVEPNELGIQTHNPIRIGKDKKEN